MESRYARREKLMFELAGRISVFVLGVVLIVLPEKFPEVSFLKRIFYDSLGIAVCAVSTVLNVGRVLRAYNWSEAKRTNSLRYIEFNPPELFP